jgi:hypothetical protein
VRNEEGFSDGIYATVLGAIASKGAFGAEAALLGNLAQVLGLNERKLEKLGLSGETVEGMDQFVR